jgi:hypothetical protein
MPTPNKGEPLSEYISRFMGAKKDQKWPQKQRAAIAYSEYAEKKQKSRKKS